MKLVLDGVDLSHYADVRNLQVGDSNISAVVGTADAVLEDWAGTMAKVPALGQEVKIYDDDGTTLIFGGQVSEMELSNLPPLGRAWHLFFQDWNESLISATCTRTLLEAGFFAPYNDFALVRSIFLEAFDRIYSTDPLTFTNQTASYMPRHPVTAANERSSPNFWPKAKATTIFANLPFDYKGMSAKAALDKLAAYIPGLFYRIGADKLLTWAQPNSEAPWIVSTSPSGSVAKPFEAYKEHWVRGNRATRFKLTGFSASQQAFDEATFADQGGTAGAGIRDLAYATDTSITDAGELQKQAHAKLRAAASDRDVLFSVRDRGLAAGQLIPVVSANLVALDRLYPGLHNAYTPFAGIGGISNSAQLASMRGYFLITKTRDVPLGNGAHRYDITAGDYVRDLPTVLAG